MPAFNTLDDLDVDGKRVVIRVDLNVPIENGEVTRRHAHRAHGADDPELLDKDAAVILLAHFDRPKGKVVPEMSLKPVAPALEASLGRPVTFVFTDWQDGKAVAAAKAQSPANACSWRTPATMPAKKRTMRRSQKCSRASAISL